MAGMDGGSAHLALTAAEPMSLTPEMAAAMTAVTADERSPMVSCEGMCASDTAADTCTMVAALTVPTLLALLLGRRCDTALGRMPRTALTTQRRRWRGGRGHLAAFLNGLCVLRV
jgi:hypothetical protein